MFLKNIKRKKSIPKSKKILISFFVLVFIGLIYFSIYFLLPSGLKIVFFDVGQGDSIFIETKDHYQILIDGGPDKTVLAKLNQEMPFWDRKIDLIVLTHPDADHLTGLIAVLEHFEVDSILTSGFKKDTLLYRKWKELIQEKQISVVLAQAGQKIFLNQNIFLEVLWPDQELINQYVEKSNNASVVLKLNYQQANFLLLGDIEKKIEKLLNQQYSQKLEADLLKAAHHGSKSSSLQEFINSINPQIVVISVGQDNRYGHPDQEVLNKFKNLILLRTDLQGDIQAETDGQKIWLELEKKL